MVDIKKADIPDLSLMVTYQNIPGCMVDSFQGNLTFSASIEEVINAFFTCPAFRPEWILLKLTRTPFTQRQDIAALAQGLGRQFAMWQTEDRNSEEILLAVGNGPIRSWLAVRPHGEGCKVYFGSAVLPNSHGADGEAKIGFMFNALAGFHNFYSRLLLKSAIRQLIRNHKSRTS